jgi:putative serine protease PepD
MTENDRQQPREHDDTQPITGAGRPAGHDAGPGATPPGPGAVQSGPGAPPLGAGAGQPGPGQPTAGPTAPGQSATGPDAPGQSVAGPGAPGQPATGPGGQVPGQSSPAQPGPAQPGHAQPAGPGGPAPAGPSPYEQHHHRYGPDHTAAYDTRAWGPGGAPFFGNAQPEPPRREKKARRGGLVAAALVGALVVGGLAGFGGAATYDLVDVTDAGSSSGGSETATSVVERKDTAAPAGSVEDVANSVLPSVVKINVRGVQGEGSGSGVVISEDGEILTNNHVVEVAAQGGSVSVAFDDGTTAPAEIVGTDPLTDLAVIKAEGVSGLKPAALGQSGNLDVGEEVVAIGSPFGLEATVTSGIVSALHRPVSISGESSAISTTYPAIQTDAAINPGNSGGPLVNMNGEVVGINSSIRTSSSSMGPGGSIGLGFAIPLDEVLPIVDQLRNGETPTHARLGISVTDARSEDGLLSGAGVAQVTGGSAGAEAGLERGDIITKVNDRPVTDASSLVATIRAHRPGDTVTLAVVRGDETLELEATLDSDEGEPLS